MQYFIENGLTKKIIIRLDENEDILKSIKEIITKLDLYNGVVISGIGTLKEARIHRILTTTYPAQEEYPEWKDTPIELSSISGVIADGEPHLHTVFSDLEKTYSGHLEEGCITLYLCEIVIEELKVSLQRKRNEKNIAQLGEK